MRHGKAELCGKEAKFRKCYIALKITSLPCNSDGTVEGQYTPRANHHPFDTTIPRVGDNFFEDVLTNPVEELNSKTTLMLTAALRILEKVAQTTSGIPDPPHITKEKQQHRRLSQF